MRIRVRPLLDLRPDSPVQFIQSITALVGSNFSRLTRPPRAEDLIETLYPLVNRCKYCGVRQTLSGKHGTWLRASVMWKSSFVRVSESALSHVALPEATPFWHPKASPYYLVSLCLSLSLAEYYCSLCQPRNFVFCFFNSVIFIFLGAKFFAYDHKKK